MYMIKMYRVIVENIDLDENPRVYVVGEKQKDFLVSALTRYKVTVEEFFVDDESEL